MNWKLKDGYFDKLDLPVGGSPVFEDMDFDGDLDMVIGTEKGTLVYFRNTGRYSAILKRCLFSRKDD